MSLYQIVQTKGKLFISPVYFQDQYIFVHNAMLEAILVGQTTVPCYQFEQKYKELQSLDGKLGISRLEQQFNVS